MIGLAFWSATPPAANVNLHLLLAPATAVVAALLAVRLRAIVGMASRLQARVNATPMALRWNALPAAVSTLTLQQLRGAGSVDPSLQRSLVLATLAWAANEEAQARERLR